MMIVSPFTVMTFAVQGGNPGSLASLSVRSLDQVVRGSSSSIVVSRISELRKTEPKWIYTELGAGGGGCHGNLSPVIRVFRT